MRTTVSPARARRGPAPLALVVYGSICALTLGVSALRSESPIETSGSLLEWTSPFARHFASLGLGLVLGILTVRASREFVRRWSWARALHADLRPAVHDTTNATLWVLAIASGVTEELFFRGLLTPALDLVVSSIAFGALHRLRGRAGWVWASWASVMGFLFGGLFLLTGSLLGPILAHVMINAMNLRFLRDTDVEPVKPRRLGGLLRTDV